MSSQNWVGVVELVQLGRDDVEFDVHIAANHVRDFDHVLALDPFCGYSRLNLSRALPRDKRW